MRAWLPFLALLLFTGSPAAAQAPASAAAPAPAVALPRMEQAVRVDGVLDEPAWAQAALLEGFWQYLPVDGRPAADSTVVRVWYAPTAIYFGIHAYGDPARIRATLADRDKIEGDDYVQLVLDTFNDQRQAFVLGVNPLGVQADGILRDAAQSTGAFGLGGGRGAYQIDFNPDFVFASKGRLTPDGYVVEVQVPFKSLRYRAGDVQVWGINVIRKVQATGHEQTWAPVAQAQASFLAQSGQLTGLSDLRRGLVLDVTPEVTARVEGADAADGWAYDGSRPRVGGNVRWGVTNNLTLNATVNPDFSQVEADVAQVEYDPRLTLFFPEKRPFFLDGIELFQMPNQLIHTRRVADPRGAVKLTGKMSGTSVALLSAVDGTSGLNGTNQVFNLLRVRRDLGGQSTLGVAYTDFVEGDRYNRVASADGQFVLGGRYTLTFQGAASVTGDGTDQTVAPLWDLRMNRSGRAHGFSASLRGLHPDFRASSGHLPRVGIVHAVLTPRITRFGREGGLLESWTGSIRLDGTWDYDRFLDARYPNDAKLHLNNAFSLRGGWRTSASLLIESFKYPPALYRNYYLVAGADTVAYTGTDRLFNLDGVLTVATPRFQRFGGNLFLIFGQDENFYEWSSAFIFFATLEMDWRPTEQLRLSLLYNHQQYNRMTDGSIVGQRRIPRLKLEYQLSRAIFVRFVGQYDAFVRDDLRDDSRTEAPILLRNPATGRLTPTTRINRNDLRVDWLFSYRPVPGTVFFLGYGSSLHEPDAFSFGGLDRRTDGFFVKLSYLFRV